MALTKPQLRKLRALPPGESGNRIALALDLLGGVSQRRLAEAIGLSQQYVSDVVRGRWETITLDNARKFCDFFGCAIEDLFPAREPALV